MKMSRWIKLHLLHVRSEKMSLSAMSVVGIFIYIPSTVLVTRKVRAKIDQSLWDTMQGNFMSNSCLCVKEVNCSYPVAHVLFYCTCNSEAQEELYTKSLKLWKQIIG